MLVVYIPVKCYNTSTTSQTVTRRKKIKPPTLRVTGRVQNRLKLLKPDIRGAQRYWRGHPLYSGRSYPALARAAAGQGPTVLEDWDDVR
jgi:hypothetical protein